MLFHATQNRRRVSRTAHNIRPDAATSSRKGKTLIQELVNSMRQNRWFVDCMTIKLVQNIAENPDEHIGPGYLKQESDGSIAYKVYPTSHAQIDLNPPPAIGIVGQLISHERFYRLEAIDSKGLVWTIKHTLPAKNQSILGPQKHFTIVAGFAHEIAYVRESSGIKTRFLRMFFFTNEKVPSNSVSNSFDGSIQTIRRDTAKFSTSFGDFLIRNTDGMLSVEVESKNPFPPHFEMRITESLGFVLARPLSWNAIQLFDDGRESVRMRSSRGTEGVKFPAPLGNHAIDPVGDQIWHLFEKYLTFVCLHLNDSFHPCSRHLFSVLEASVGALSWRALALGVAVEGITDVLFPQSGLSPETLKSMVSRLEQHIEDWSEFKDADNPDLADSDLARSLHTRISSMLSRICEVSAATKLFALKDKGVIFEKNIQAWKKLRHASAHGVTPGSRDTQKLLNYCDSVTVLMYHLIFGAIGYSGEYKDYSDTGWPMKPYGDSSTK